VSARLAESGVEAGHYVPCVHLQPYMRERFGFAEGLCPAAEDFSGRALALPFFTEIEPGDQERVVEALAAAL
jgi:perosamine synthetase